MSEDRGKLRISNADRDEAIALLKQALDEGRLDLSEFDARSQSVYEAKTNAELDLIFEDLPVERTARSVEPATGPDGRPAGKKKKKKESAASGVFQAFIWVGCITTAVWFVSNITKIGPGEPHPEWANFWPGYPMGILLAITIAAWITDRFSKD